MKSLKELVDYYKGIPMGAFATSEQGFGSGSSRITLGDGRRDIDGSILYDADRLTKAAVVSFLASSRLLSGAHQTWADIALYYARFHSIGALLRLAGIVPVRSRLLLRTNEACHAYSVVSKADSAAEAVGFTGVGSHIKIWKMFSRTFRDWTDPEPRAATSILTEDPEAEEALGLESYKFPSMQRNQANYLQKFAGVFFPETDLTGMHEFTVSTARQMGNWDWLRTDDNPLSDEEPPEAYFHEQMMAWDLIKYLAGALVALEGQRLLDQYIWIIRNVDAHDALSEHMIGDLRSLPVEDGPSP